MVLPAEKVFQPGSHYRHSFVILLSAFVCGKLIFEFDRRFPVACYGVTIFPSPLRGEGWGEGDKLLIPQIPRCVASGEVHLEKYLLFREAHLRSLYVGGIAYRCKDGRDQVVGKFEDP